MEIKPYDFQESHIHQLQVMLLKHGIVIDNSSTGAGKTITSLFACKRLGLKPYIVCTKSVMDYWRDWADMMEVEVVGVKNYESLLSDTSITRKETPREFRKRMLAAIKKCQTAVEREDLKEILRRDDPADYKFKREYMNFQNHPNKDIIGGWKYVKRDWRWRFDPDSTLLIFDEAHKLGGMKSKVSLMLKAAKDQDLNTLLLSATLIDSPLRMRTLAYALGLFRGWSTVKFKAWCRLHGCDDGDVGKLVFDGDQEYIEEIKDAIGERMFGINTADLPDFPESQLVLLSVPYKGANLDNAYAKELEELEGEATTEGVACLRSRQLSEWGKRSWILERAKENEAEGLSVVIFTSFYATGEHLSEKLNCPFIAGDRPGVPKRDRSGDIAKFQRNETHFIIVMVDAGGESISLHDLHGRPRVVYCSPGHNGTTFQQLLGRVPRAGSQQSKVMQYILFARGSQVEARVRYNLQKKTATIQTISDNDLSVMPKELIKSENIDCQDSPTGRESDMAETVRCKKCKMMTCLAQEGLCTTCYANKEFVDNVKITPTVRCEECNCVMPPEEEEYALCAKCEELEL